MRKQNVIVILVVVAIAIVLVVVGSMSGKGGAGANAGGPATTTPAPTTTTTTTTPSGPDPDAGLVTFSGALPFSVPAAPGLEVRGGALASGEATIPADEAGVVTRLVEEPGMVWVLVDFYPTQRRSLLGRSVSLAERVVPPILHASSQQYEALGFFYDDGVERRVRVTPSQPMRGLSESPEIQRPSQRFWVVFRVPRGSEVRALTLGAKEVIDWDPPLIAR